MPVSAGVGIALLLLGAGVRTPGPLLLGVLILLTAGLTEAWSRRGLHRLVYQRRLERVRAVVGDVVPLDLVVRNEKLLPLPFVRIEDLVDEELVLRGRGLSRSDQPGRAAIDEAWSVAAFQQVVRRREVVADRRGVRRFGPVRLRVADLFGRTAVGREIAMPAELVIRPPLVPLRPPLGRRTAPGDRRSVSALHEDPALFAGVRPFQPGDPLRRIHWRATARLGQAVSRRFDPSQSRTALVVIDLQTLDEPHWLLAYDEDLVESLIVASGSLVRALLADGIAVGLAAAGWTGTTQRLAYLAPASGPGQLSLAADLLARLSPFASAPFEAILRTLPWRVPRGASLHVLTGRDPSSSLPALRRLRRAGFEVELLCLGRAAPRAVAAARAAGLTASAAQVRPDWRAPAVVELAG